jgi:redox-sensitive bicupin YhaK (pirin superfamily)
MAYYAKSDKLFLCEFGQRRRTITKRLCSLRSLLLIHRAKRPAVGWRLSTFLWVQVAEGEVTLNDKTLKGGDAAAVSRESTLELVGKDKSQVLLFDLN